MTNQILETILKQERWSLLCQIYMTDGTLLWDLDTVPPTILKRLKGYKCRFHLSYDYEKLRGLTKS